MDRQAGRSSLRWRLSVCWIPSNTSFVGVGQDLRHGSGRKVARFFGQYPRVKARLVSLYWIVFARPRRLNSQHSRLSQGRTSGAVGVTSSWGLAAACFTNTLGLKGPPQPDDLRSFWKAVNSKALTAREREHDQKHDTSPACLVCEAPVDNTDHYFFGCVDSRSDAEYTTLQRLFGLPKLKAKLSEQEGAGRTIEIFTGMVLEMISSGRWRMQKLGTRMESLQRRRVVLEERMKLRAGGARGGRGQ
ncbi:BZ3500_MvSof-1268-A1-R1_Chr3-3g06448 [Microbotryum saponariae]|uniref:BZ3500_MvSof-1268-A1-R1_Chr3-3g06448 protein n=1 Tax=Microbotryum saponariae TaxID=289078 RepID=A0A2X0M5F5_9BASI|nr:BZ3500_MvSof-1268-A1-R1_Chr3-3g06448 [Microbotryum saponariae]SDA04415.1 BZ3501_MvSof-1269-A2-R1_Chr3-2g06135 [Microbotryum saponariae]